jgi:hypothetical protein
MTAEIQNSLSIRIIYHLTAIKESLLCAVTADIGIFRPIIGRINRRMRTPHCPENPELRSATPDVFRSIATLALLGHHSKPLPAFSSIGCALETDGPLR